MENLGEPLGPAGCRATAVGNEKFDGIAEGYAGRDSVSHYEVAIACGARVLSFAAGKDVIAARNDVDTILKGICIDCPNYPTNGAGERTPFTR